MEVVDSLLTLTLRYSPPRFKAYSAACSASLWRSSLVAVFCSNNATLVEARTMTVKMISTIKVTQPGQVLLTVKIGTTAVEQ